MGFRRSLIAIAFVTTLVGCSLFVSLDSLQDGVAADAGTTSDATTPSSDASSPIDSGSRDATTIDAALPPILLVQSATGTVTSGTVTTVMATFTQPVVAGDTLIVFTSWGANDGIVTSISDTAGNTFTLAGTVARSNNASEGLAEALYFSPNVKAAASDTVTVVYSASFETPDIRMGEYSGMSTTAPYSGQMASNFGDAAPVVPFNVTLANRYVVVGGGSAWGNYTGDAPQGFTVHILNNDEGFFADQFSSGPESIDGGFPLVGEASWLAILAAFQ